MNKGQLTRFALYGLILGAVGGMGIWIAHKPPVRKPPVQYHLPTEAETKAALEAMQHWSEFTPDATNAHNVLEHLRKDAGLANPLIGNVGKAARFGGGYHSSGIWLVSLSRDQYEAFREGVIKAGARSIVSPIQIDSDKNSSNSAQDCPKWWNPPEVECLQWMREGANNAIYDKERQLLFFSNTE